MKLAVDSRPMGESALLLQLPDAPTTLDTYRRLRAVAPPWVVELVPAATTVLLVFDRSRIAPKSVRAWLDHALDPEAPNPPDHATRHDLASAQTSPADPTTPPGTEPTRVRTSDPTTPLGIAPTNVRASDPTTPFGTEPIRVRTSEPITPLGTTIEIRVRYDGPDLEEVARLTGLAVDEVIAAHTRSTWSAAFIGFAPGFAYLTGDDRRLDVPRRSTPRPTVPAGSVALAAGYCGIYPRESPGGWHLIGTTDAVLWDASREQPALLAPGTEVRFVRE
ncbi:allophanate hydrolase subunit 1 [Herbiconiux sp. P15]|uniref:5-oxoprolinase subunit B family protein n=1 Tax=Herbiconiux liukaitaii TaxID=3342799 RepID=UPI0035BA1655